jgi:hypothetical protein
VAFPVVEVVDMVYAFVVVVSAVVAAVVVVAEFADLVVAESGADPFVKG